jgi:hypothetical protein
VAGLTFNNEAAQSTPFSVTVVVGSQNPVSAPSPQTFNRSTYFFSSWSDGGPQNHTITSHEHDLHGGLPEALTAPGRLGG